MSVDFLGHPGLFYSCFLLSSLLYIVVDIVLTGFSKNKLNLVIFF